MFTGTWQKYLPVIAILLKRAAKAEQTLNMDQTDFKRAAGGKKIKFSFSNLQLNDGRTDYNTNLSPIAKEFVQSLINNETTKTLVMNQQFEFALTNDFQLLIKNNTLAASDAPVAPE